MTPKTKRAIAERNGDLMTHDKAEALARRVFYIALAGCIAYVLAALLLVSRA